MVAQQAASPVNRAIEKIRVRPFATDGSELMVPKNAVVELKFPETDIIGKAT